MMDNLRKVASSTIFKIIFALIILSFIFAGIGGIFSPSSLSSKPYVAKIGNEKISTELFDQMFQSNILRKQPSINPDFKKMLRDKYLNQLINESATYEYAKKLGITVTDEQVKAELRENPAFKVDGVFNNERYINTLIKNNFSPTVYAESIRSSLTRIYAGPQVVESDFILPVDKEVLPLMAQKRTVYTGSIPVSAYDKEVPEFPAEEKLAFYNTHPELYQRNDMIKVQFTGISLNEVEKGITITDAELRDYYQKNIKSLTQPERQNLLLVRVKTREQAEVIKKELDEGNLLENIVNEKSLTKSATNIGWIDINESAPKEIIQAGLKQPGQYSDVIPMNDEYAIFKLNAITVLKTKSFEDAYNEIKTTLIKERGQTKFENLQEEISALTKSQPNSIEPVSKLTGVEQKETYWLERNAKSNEFFYFSLKELNNEINNLVDEFKGRPVNSDIIYVMKDDQPLVFVLRIADFIPKGVLPYEQAELLVQSQMKQDWIKSKIEEKTQLVMTELDKGNTNILNTEKIAFATQYTLTSSDYQKLDQSLVDKIFEAPIPINNKTVYGYDYSDEIGATFFALIKVENDMSVIGDDAKIQFFNLPQFRHLYNVLMNSVRSKIDIKINEES